MASPTLRALPAETASNPRRPSRPITLRRYAVLVDGVEVGQVFQHRAETVHGYANSRLGYSTERTAWGWESTDDPMGGYEMNTRREAVEDLLDALDLSEEA